MSVTLYSSLPGTTSGLRKRLTALAATLLLAPAAAWAQAPANDNCSGATALTVGATCTVTTGTNVGATASTAPTPAPTCGGSSSGATADVWYSIVVPTGGTVTVTTSAITGSAFDDTVLELYSGTCGSLTSVGCNDDTGGFFSSVTATGQQVGSTIYARVMAYGTTTAAGQFGICATVPASAPANDNPTGAIALTLSSTCTPVNGTNAGATTTTPNGYANPGAAPYATCGIAVSPKDVWYTFTTAATGAGSTTATITVTGAPAGYLRAFSAASSAGPFTEIACSSSGSNNTVSAPLALTGLTPSTTYYVSVAGYGSADTQGAFTICASFPPAVDGAVQNIYTLGSVSATYGSPVTVQAVITNTGASVLSNLPVVLTVSGATTYTNGQVVPTLAVGASATVTFPSFPVTATTGTNTITVTLPTTDGNAANNTQTFAQTVTPATLSYVSGTTFTGGAGVEAANSIIAVRYQSTGAASVRTVTPTFTTGTANTFYVKVYSAAANGPGTLLYTSPVQTRPATAGAVPVSLPGVNVNGAFYVAVQNIAATNIAIAYQTEAPLRGGTFFFTVDNGATWTDINTSGLNSRLAIDATLGAPLANKDAIGTGTLSVYPNPAHQSFTLSLPAIAGQRTAQVALLNSLGQTVKTTSVALSASGTEAPVDVTGLAAGLYTVRVKAGDQTAFKQVAVQ